MSLQSFPSVREVSAWARQMKGGTCVYIVVFDNAFKIGYTSCFEIRIKALACHEFARDSKVISLMVGPPCSRSPETEQACHRLLFGLRKEAEGYAGKEWYVRNPRIESAMADYIAKKSNALDFWQIRDLLPTPVSLKTEIFLKFSCKRRHAMKPPIGRSEYAQRVFAADVAAAKP